MEALNNRSRLFRHLDGLVTAPVAYSLLQGGIIEEISQHSETTLRFLTKKVKSNEGYLNVALRVLASQGFINYRLDPISHDVFLSHNDKTLIAFRYFKYYQKVVEFIQFTGNFHPRKFEVEPFLKQRILFDHYRRRFDFPTPERELEQEIQDQILYHLEGCIVSPTLVRLGMNGMFHKYFMETRFKPDEFHQYPEHFAEILNFFCDLGWFKERNGFYEFTDSGLFFAKRASAYGVTVSYLPLFRKMDELLFGNPNVLKDVPVGESELHVDREMNVWGSGGAHASYFKVVDDIIIELFNQPIELQPKGILDMGCGNGAFLQHLFEVIDRYTLRGKMLEEHPLFLVGADYNEAALKVTRANLINADIWAKVIWGDIGDPDRLAHDLRDNYGIELSDLLNVRTFLDHNRIWKDPNVIDKNRISSSSGAFAYRGKRIYNNLVEDNLLEHLTLWKPYVEKFGLLLIELHTIAPEIVSRHLGKTAATAYDATHGFSDQYIVEINVLHKVAQEAGLEPDAKLFHRFPDGEHATISIQLLKGIKSST